MAIKMSLTTLFACFSFDDLSKDAIQTDVLMLIVGFGMMFIYVQIMLGGFNLVEQRVSPRKIRKSCIGLSIKLVAKS